MKIKPLILWLLFAFIVLDIGSTYLMFARTGTKALEVSPLYVFFGNFWIVILVNFFSLFVFYWVFTKYESKPEIIFIMIAIVVWLCIPKSLVAYNNYQLIINPPEKEAIEKYVQQVVPTEQAKVSYFSRFVGLFLLIPLIITWIIYRIFNIEFVPRRIK